VCNTYIQITRKTKRSKNLQTKTPYDQKHIWSSRVLQITRQATTPPSTEERKKRKKKNIHPRKRRVGEGLENMGTDKKGRKPSRWL